jgi:glycopeptide antibiotics resistance protein
MEHEPPKSRARIWLSVLLLIVYAAFVLVVTMSPIPVDSGYQSAISKALAVAHRHGVPQSFGYNKLEFTANIAMFVPLGFLIALALPQKAWWLVLVIAPAFSGAIELTQGAVLPHRFEDISDFISNSIGGYIGAFFAVLLRAIVNARDETVVRRAIWEYEHGRFTV